MKNAIEKFEHKNMAAFKTLAMIKTSEQQLKKQKEQIQELIFEGMQKNNIASIDNDIVRINLIPETESVSIDTKALLMSEPDLYHEIESKYNKKNTKKAHVRITVK